MITITENDCYMHICQIQKTKDCKMFTPDALTLSLHKEICFSKIILAKVLESLPKDTYLFIFW